MIVMDCALECFRGFAACLKGAKEKGVIYGKDMYEAGAVKDLPVMEETYHMGRQV